MKGFFSKVFLIFLVGFFLVGFPELVSAHTFGGPPFLKVDGEYVRENPYYQGQVTLQVAQDLGPESYLVGKGVRFEIDLGALLKQTTLPADVARQLSFRWAYAEGDNFERVSSYRDGNSVEYSFAEPGSYLVIVEGKLTGDVDWIVLDTVQVDVLPRGSYKVPEVSVFVGTDSFASEVPVWLVSRAVFDPSVKGKRYLWDFGEGKMYEGLSYEKSFAELNAFSLGLVYHRVVDDRGIMRDVGFTVSHVEDRLKFAPFGNMKRVRVEYGSVGEAKKLVVVKESGSFSMWGGWVLYALGGVVVVGLVWIGFRRFLWLFIPVEHR